MAGSYNHVVTDHGNLSSPEMVNRMLENGGDVYEAVEEMYGMIWYLAGMTEGDRAGRPPEFLVEEAREAYRQGLETAKLNKNKKRPS